MNTANNSIWSINAKSSLWKRKENSDLPKLELPEIGKEYLINIDGRDIKFGDNYDIEYLPALAYFNGVETITELESIRVFSGIVRSITPSKCSDNQRLEFNSEVKFATQDARSIRDFGKQTAKSADDLKLWSYFLEGFFYNLTNLGEYILLSWDSESYAGSTCFLQRKNNQLFLLRCHEYQDGIYDRVQYGRIVVPSALTDRLNNRLLTLKRGSHWSGNSI